ncbi:zinc-finger-containing protein [Bacillus thuringiensis]|uniref:Uncharacterized protein n=1 Tax=Bacillus thuringiensis TaxID=1428 RepID=A0A9W3VHZ4_BACTU|nr:zinc-finger-containing protein [Bacillus thuringiensis]AMR06488.1 hypothetical protein AXW78_29745 [Bacillus thuringiensis]AYF85198.1 hypothetical protein D7J84_29785 [Bacillus thuringiensis]PNK35038.1 hypothetical protein CBR55_27360 [Bacillus thuringiensis]
MKTIKNCHNCGSEKVKKESNSIIYGREYGNGKCYYCHDCKANVGTHSNGNPLGTLATKDVQILRKACHEIFDKLWRHERVASRGRLYTCLAERLRISSNECHFGMFQRERCLQALEIITQEKWWAK